METLPLYSAGIEEGRRLEREAITEWLRLQVIKHIDDDSSIGQHYAMFLQYARNRIECGAHTKDPIPSEPPEEGGR